MENVAAAVGDANYEGPHLIIGIFRSSQNKNELLLISLKRDRRTEGNVKWANLLPEFIINKLFVCSTA